MPTKRNRAGKQQNYVEAGHGDASGEYGDNATGSNKHFQSFKKPDGNEINENYEKIRSDIENSYNYGILFKNRHIIQEDIIEAYDKGLLNDDEVTNLINSIDKYIEEEKTKAKEKEKQDYSNYYKGKGKENLNGVLGDKLKGSSGKITPNGKKLMEQISNADDEMSGVIGDFYKNNRDVNINIGKNYNSAFNRSSFMGNIINRSITLGGEAIGVGDKSNNYAQGSAFFHESGHALDYTYENNHSKSWSYHYKSQNYGKTMSDMIKEEIEANVDYEKIKKEFEDAKESYKTPEYDSWVKEKDQLQSEIDTIGKQVYNNPDLKQKTDELYQLRKQKVDAWRNGNYEGMKTIQDQLDVKQNEWTEFEKSLYPNDYQQRYSRLKELRNKIFNAKEKAYSDANIKYGDMSDMLQASLGKRMGMGHGDNYFNSDVDNRGTEAFAEIMSAKATNPQSLEVMKKYIPKTLEIFDEIITHIKKRG